MSPGLDLDFSPFPAKTPPSEPVRKMANVFNDVGIRTHDQETFELTYQVGPEKTWRKITVKDQDFHFMNKFDLAKIYEG